MLATKISQTPILLIQVLMLQVSQCEYQQLNRYSSYSLVGTTLRFLLAEWQGLLPFFLFVLQIVQSTCTTSLIGSFLSHVPAQCYTVFKIPKNCPLNQQEWILCSTSSFFNFIFLSPHQLNKSQNTLSLHQKQPTSYSLSGFFQQNPKLKIHEED